MVAARLHRYAGGAVLVTGGLNVEAAAEVGLRASPGPLPGGFASDAVVADLEPTAATSRRRVTTSPPSWPRP
jgi:hypothetical protein